MTEADGDDGRIGLEQIPAVYDLGVMLVSITPETLHELVDFGPAVGEEVW